MELSWAILFGHVVAFASRNALPQQDQDFKWVSASYVGSIWGQSTAILWPRWCHLGANFGDFGAVLKAIWDHFRPCYFDILKNNPKLYLQNALPSGPRRRNRINTKNQAKTKISSKTLIPMAVTAKRNQKPTQNPPSKRFPQWPCNSAQKIPPSLAELYEMTMFLRKLQARRQEPH